MLRPGAFLLLALTLLACTQPADQEASRRPPNIVFLLLDDMGYADVGAYGNAYHKTPNIDRLAADGMRFTDAYAAAPNCSPTRGSILTGRWPARNRVTQYLPGNVLPYAKLLQAELPLGLPLSEAVIAEPLQAAGYATASIGKWHLGGGDYAPQNRGFDLAFAGGHWNAHKSMFAPHPFVEVPDSQEGDYLTDRLTSEAIKFIEANQENPFFIYLPYYAIHTPIQAKQDLIDGYQGREDPTGRNNAVYAAMTEGVDQSVGALVAKLDELGLSEDTMIVFFSDNGGVPRLAFNGGFRSGKGYLWEGGVREPLIIKWPGVVEPGAVERTPVQSIDFYPTILEAAGVPDLDGHAVDGESLMPLLRGQAQSWTRDTLYWHYPHYANAGSTPTGSIRRGDWKLIEFFEDSHVELYQLAEDPSESNDRAAEQPERAAELQAALATWRSEVDALPAPPNPDYDPARAKERKGYAYHPVWNPTDPIRND